MSSPLQPTTPQRRAPLLPSRSSPATPSPLCRSYTYTPKKHGFHPIRSFGPSTSTSTTSSDGVGSYGCTPLKPKMKPLNRSFPPSPTVPSQPASISSATPSRRNGKMGDKTTPTPGKIFIGRRRRSPFVFSRSPLTHSNMTWLKTGIVDETLYLRDLGGAHDDDRNPFLALAPDSSLGSEVDADLNRGIMRHRDTDTNRPSRPIQYLGKRKRSTARPTVGHSDDRVGRNLTSSSSSMRFSSPSAYQADKLVDLTLTLTDTDTDTDGDGDGDEADDDVFML